MQHKKHRNPIHRVITKENNAITSDKAKTPEKGVTTNNAFDAFDDRRAMP